MLVRWTARSACARHQCRPYECDFAPTLPETPLPTQLPPKRKMPRPEAEANTTRKSFFLTLYFQNINWKESTVAIFQNL